MLAGLATLTGCANEAQTLTLDPPQNQVGELVKAARTESAVGQVSRMLVDESGKVTIHDSTGKTFTLQLGKEDLTNLKAALAAASEQAPSGQPGLDETTYLVSVEGSNWTLTRSTAPTKWKAVLNLLDGYFKQGSKDGKPLRFI